MAIGEEILSIKINIKHPKKFKAHRYGWGFVIDSLIKFHSSKGILFDDFIDITFGYRNIENIENRSIPYKCPWIGVLHHPPKICPWYEDKYKNNIDIHNFLNSVEFLISLEKCEGIIVLSNYLKEYLLKNFQQFKNIPIINIKHPTGPPELKWDFNKFKKSSSAYGTKILNIGYFLRNMTSIYFLKSNRKLDKYLLPSDIRYGLQNLSREINFKKLKLDKNSIKILNWQDHSFYDKLLEQSISFLDLYDTSCNNAVIESVIRETPLIVNNHPAVKEYVGEDYPLLFDDIKETHNMINNDLIYEAHEYLTKYNQNRHLTTEYFLYDFVKKITDITNISAYSRKKIKKQNNTETIVKTCSNNFKHRHGWPWVTNEIYQKFDRSIEGSNHNKIYINNFVDHVFKKDAAPKTVNINNNIYGVFRGYNLFPYNNTELLSIENSYYSWKNNAWELEKSNQNLQSIIEVNSINNYKTHEWIGFLHNPVNMPSWFDYGQNINSLLQNEDFISCLKNCKKLFVFSNKLKRDLNNIFKQNNIAFNKIQFIHHPIPDPIKTFNYKQYIRQNKTNIIQIGYWLRKMNSIWNLKTKHNQNKIWLYGDKFAAEMFKAECSATNISKLKNSEVDSVVESIRNSKNAQVKNVSISSLSSSDYDKIKQTSICFIDLYDTSANNTILECLSSGTPILVNQNEAVLDYLTKDYPLFYTDLDHAYSLMCDRNQILAAHEYLLDRFNALKNKLSIDTFLNTLKLEINKICKK